MKRPTPKIRKSAGKWGGHYCDLCAADANSQPTCKEERENSPVEEDNSTYRCTRKRLHGGDHAACGNDAQEENHPIVLWRGKRTRRRASHLERNSANAEAVAAKIDKKER